MRSGQLFFSAAEFLLIIALFFLGAIFFGLHYLPAARIELSEWILQSSDLFFLIGCAIGGTALLLTLCFWVIHRQKFFRVEMKGDPFFLDEALVKGLVQQFWKEEFPEEKKGIEVYFARKKIEVIASCPKSEDLEVCLEEVEVRLSDLLQKKLGYRDEFFLTLTASQALTTR